MRRKTVILFLFLFLVSGFSFSAVENIKVSGEVITHGIMRNYSLGLKGANILGSSVADEESFLVSQMRIQFDADLSEDVQGVISFLSENLWGAETSTNTDVDLDLAYLKIKDFLGYPLTFTVGRQNLKFGTGFIVGDPDTDFSTSSASPLYHIADSLSLRKGFDALRITWELEPFVVDLIYSLIDEGSSTSINDDVRLYGLNINYSPEEKSTYELYFFAKDNDYNTYFKSLAELGYPYSETIQDAENKVYCLGGRINKDINKHLAVNFEVAHQFGDFRDGTGLHAKRDAWGAQLSLDYKFLNQAYSMIGFWYTFLSGDEDPLSSTEGVGYLYTAWDEMFEDQSGPEIIGVVLPQSNSHTFLLYYFTYLSEKINILAKYSHVRLVKNHYASTYTLTRGPLYGNVYYLDSKNKHLGDEVDLKLTYDYSENMHFILTGGVMFPGGLLASQNDNTGYLLKLTAKVNF